MLKPKVDERFEKINIKDNFTILLTYPKEDPSYVYFETYEIAAYEEGLNVPFYQKRESDVSPDLTRVLEDAEEYISGSIKWDGCSNIDFGSSYHFCGKKNAMKMGKLIDYLYDKCAKVLKVKEKGNEDLYN